MKTRIGSVTQMPAEGEAKEFDYAGKEICVARVNGKLFAMDNVCPHRGGPLAQGVIDEGKLICPWHGWQFDIATGNSVQVPDTGVAVFTVTVEGADVFVES